MGCIPKWGRVSGYLWGVTLGCSARYSGQPQIWDASGRWVQFKMGACLWPATRAAGETPAFPGGCPQIWDAPREMACIQDIWRASRTILPATRGAGETPAIPRGYAIISDAPLTGPLTGRIPDDWGELPDHWRLRPGRWVWPHLTDNQLGCTHNNPGDTRRTIDWDASERFRGQREHGRP